ncbi:ribonuclease HII [Bacillus luteolus]|uniref:Ribonuclease HII n=1 Tax=Litchfieldia luteola TaxID=682179 RepID=A0ABR9QJZ9_9BACI|nr:ribonuclease HII [Cytobacillus luteolus]MBE4908746.1 ribonuclease HII [Cytobacillus luteolus]MBP1941605.1 ribonuclease HII [Cytobacillus luteolus]
MKNKTIKDIEQMLEGIIDSNHPLIAEYKKDDRVGVQKALTRWEKTKRETESLELLFKEMSEYENNLYHQGINTIAGVDEVGRGPLAGPVVAAAVILPKGFKLLGLNDSKKLTDNMKNDLFEAINKEALAIGIGIISAEKIDEVNIYEATKLAMVKAINQLSIKPEHLLIDAMKLPINIPQTSIIKGDSASISIAASSIVAKVTRDRLMKRLGDIYPEYGFENHMGYGTKEHINALQEFGSTIEHRQSFAPVASVKKMF